MKSFEFFICHTKALSPCHTEHSEVSIIESKKSYFMLQLLTKPYKRI